MGWRYVFDKNYRNLEIFYIYFESILLLEEFYEIFIKLS